MTAPPWGHKPLAVDPDRYHLTPPPGLSARCLYWLRRADDGNWRPNRHLWSQGYDGRARWLGVSIWESQKIIEPFLHNLQEHPHFGCTRALGHNVSDCCGSCHADEEDYGVYMCDGYDIRGRDLHACCKASTISGDLIKRIPWDVRMAARR